MTLQEERARLYQSLAAEVQEMKNSLSECSDKIDIAVGTVKDSDTGDARENAGLDIAKDELVGLYREVVRIQAILAKFQEVEELELYQTLFPENIDSIPSRCMRYNHVGKAVLYSTLRVDVKRGNGNVSEMILMLMPAGFNFKTRGCSSVDTPAARLMLNARQGQTIPYTCSTGEKVEYTIKEIL